LSKKRKNFSLDKNIAERLENEVENQSRIVNDLLHSYLRNDIDDEVSLDEKKERLEDKLQDLKEERDREIEKYEKKISTVKADLQAVEEKLERQENNWTEVETEQGIRISSGFVKDKWTDKNKTRQVVTQKKVECDVSGKILDKGTPVVVDLERGKIWHQNESRPNNDFDNHKSGVVTEVKA